VEVNVASNLRTSHVQVDLAHVFTILCPCPRFQSSNDDRLAEPCSCSRCRLRCCCWRICRSKDSDMNLPCRIRSLTGRARSIFDLRGLMNQPVMRLRDQSESENFCYQTWAISGSIFPSEILSNPTVGLVMNGSIGLVGLPGLISNRLFSHLIEGE